MQGTNFSEMRNIVWELTSSGLSEEIVLKSNVEYFCLLLYHEF